MGLEQAQPTQEPQPSSENLDRETQLIERYLEGVEPGSARAWALADHIAYREARIALEDAQFSLFNGKDKDPLEKIKKESDLHIGEQIMVATMMRIDNHIVTIKGYAQADYFLDELMYKVKLKINDDEGAYSWLQDRTDSLFDDPKDNLEDLIDSYEEGKPISDPEASE